MAAYQRKDAAYRDAKKRGQRSRAAPKLEELDKHFRLFKPGMAVLDLGCWPGGWLQVAGKAVGDTGRVVGVDLVETDPLTVPNVMTFTGDVTDPECMQRLRDALGRPADVVLSDLAPKLTGVKVADRERHMELVDMAVQVAEELLVEGGAFLIKLFGGVESEATAMLKTRIGKVTKLRPESTRKGSSEIYACAVRRSG